MGNPFRPLTRQSRSPSRPSAVRRGSSSASTSTSQQQHDPTSSQHSVNLHPTQYVPSPVTTPGSGERSTKRLKLTVRKPTIASSAARHGHGAKKDDSSSSSNPPPPRPPTRLTIARPHGDLLQTTNGVQTTLKFEPVQRVEQVEQVERVERDPAGTDTSRDTTVELSQRQPRASSDRRSLRSQGEGSRLKSDLAVYFPEYKDVLYDEHKEPELLDIDTIITLSDESYGSPAKPKGKSKDKNKAEDKDTIQVGQRHLTSPRANASASSNTTSPSHDRNRFNGAQIVDFSTIEKSVGHHPRDPLTDSFYFKSHRRAERKEKQLRNIEKERAMHEKAQLEKLLEGLQGHDWLRMMGITGVTESEARKYESKRDYFVSEVKALLMKFKMWKEEERRLKLEKEAAAAAEEEAEEEEDEAEETEGDDGQASSSDFDGAAARQLQMEASGGAKEKGGKGDKGGKGGKGDKGKQRERAAPPQPPAPPPAPTVLRPPTPEGPFVSFYSKPHLRAAALGKARHGRNLTAFGQPLPEPDEVEFVLPEDYMTPESIKESARRRRRMKRESLVDSSAKK